MPLRPLFPLLVLLPAMAIPACGGSPAPQSPASESPPSPRPAADARAGSVVNAPAASVDPVAEGLTVEGERRLCDEHLARGQALLGQVKALKGAPAEKLTWDATLGRFDDALFEFSNAQEFPQLMVVAHPDKAVREEAKLCAPKAEKLTTSMYLDAELASVVKAYAAKNEKLTGPASEEKTRFLAETLRDFRRNGLDLPEDKRQRLRTLNAEITDLAQKFGANIGDMTGKITVGPKSLQGLPSDYVAKHPAKDGKIEITTDYPDYFPFITYSKDRAKALELYVLFSNRGGNENVQILDHLLKARYEKAKLLGYPTWADYAIEPLMAKSAKTVHDFLEQVKGAVKESANKEYAELMKEHVALGGRATDKLAPVERYYLEDRVRSKKYKFDSQELSNYFEINAVRKGLFDITSRMYGLEYKEVPANAWHPDVTAYEMRSKDGKLIGKFYLDLYPREGKFKHAAMYVIRRGRHIDGGYQIPEAVLECNFPKTTGPDSPGLMTHGEVETFFHEFGHVMHNLFGRTETAAYAGTNTVADFVEAPSQMFEEWVWTRETLDIFGKHWKTGAKIPDALFDAMLKSRAFGRGLATDRQLFLAMLDQAYHTKTPPFDTTQVLQEVQATIEPFVYVKGTHFQSSFGHLASGYDAGYYGYQWALAVAQDVLTRFKKEGLLNPTTAAAWREEVLSKGGGIDERTMIRRFLGREPSSDAYIEFLKGKH